MAKKRNISVEDLWALERVGAPSLSPDGQQAVAVVSSFDMGKNSSSSALWLFDTSSSKTRPRRLTRSGGKDGSPLFSPRGEQIAFLAQRDQEGHKDSQKQLYLINPSGGEARRAGDVATGIEAFKWCPDGKGLLLVSWVWPELRGAKAQAKQFKVFNERKESGFATSEASYRHWDHNLPMGRVPHLLLLQPGPEGSAGKLRDLFEGTPYELTRAEPGTSHFDISPDGQHVAFVFDPAREKRGDGRFALAEMNLKSGRVKVFIQETAWDLSSPCYSPDGQRIAFTASHQGLKHTMPSVLALLERKSGQWQRCSEAWDHEVHAPLRWQADGQALLFCTEDKGRRHLWRFELASQSAQVVAEGGWVSAFDVAADASADTTVFLLDSASHPVQLHAQTAAGPARRLDRFNDKLMGSLALGAVEEVWFKGGAVDKKRGADDVQMWVVYPPGFDAKKTYPVLHNIHGGPHTGPGDNWHYRWNTQLFAAQGYVVASVNYHGSSGFGHAFLDSITHRWGALELQDVEAGTDWLLQQPWSDPKRVFAAGGSYGGYMVAWMNGHVPAGRYQAYICHAGCFDWVGMFADDAWYWHAKELGAWYWDDLKQVHSQSPHAFAKNFNTPTLVIHGALDYRVPDAQGLAYYNTLKAQGIDARLLWYPDENHWILKPRNSQQWYGEFLGWLQAHDVPAGAAGRKTKKRPTLTSKKPARALK